MHRLPETPDVILDIVNYQGAHTGVQEQGFGQVISRKEHKGDSAVMQMCFCILVTHGSDWYMET